MANKIQRLVLTDNGFKEISVSKKESDMVIKDLLKKDKEMLDILKKL